MEFSKVIKERFSVRQFSDKTIDDAKPAEGHIKKKSMDELVEYV